MEIPSRLIPYRPIAAMYCSATLQVVGNDSICAERTEFPTGISIRDNYVCRGPAMLMRTRPVRAQVLILGWRICPKARSLPRNGRPSPPIGGAIGGADGRLYGSRNWGAAKTPANWRRNWRCATESYMGVGLGRRQNPRQLAAQLAARWKAIWEWHLWAPPKLPPIGGAIGGARRKAIWEWHLWLAAKTPANWRRGGRLYEIRFRYCIIVKISVSYQTNFPYFPF